eukprot:133271-Rhodomonas_salina.2
MECVAKITQEIMQLLHDCWSHQSNSKMEQIKERKWKDYGAEAASRDGDRANSWHQTGVQLVVMGKRMQEGEDYEDSFTPVPHATSGCIIISIAAAQDLELHSCDLAQAFIQADKLD